MVLSKGGCTAVILTAVLAGIFFFTPCAVQAQAGNEGRRDASFPVARTLKVDISPVVDGSLDEDVWQSAEVLGNFIQRIPSDGAPASEPTEVRVLYTNEALYVLSLIHI